MRSLFFFALLLTACEETASFVADTDGGPTSPPPPRPDAGRVEGGQPPDKWPTAYPSPAKGATGGSITCHATDAFLDLVWVWHVDAQSALAVEPRSASSIASALAPHAGLGSYITSIDSSYAFAFHRTSGELVTAYVASDGPMVEVVNAGGAIAVSSSRIDTGGDSRAADAYFRTGDGTIAARSVGPVVAGLSLGDDVIGSTVGASGAQDVTVTFSNREVDAGAGIFSAKKKANADAGSGPELRRLVSGLSDPHHLRLVGSTAIFFDRIADGRVALKSATLAAGQTDPAVTVLVNPTKGLKDFAVAPSNDPNKRIVYAAVVPTEGFNEAKILKVDLATNTVTTFKKDLTALRGITVCGDRVFWTNADASVSSAPLD